MSDRTKTIWNLIVGFFVVSIIAAGFKLFPMNKKYDRIKDRSRNLQFGTDEELKNVIAFLEKRLEERNNYQFMIQKEPMILTNVLSLDGSGRRSRRNKSALRVALIYQRENNFQAQIDYRGKIFGITAGESIENIGEIVLIDQSQVIIKNENRLMSYPAPGKGNGLPKELTDFSFKENNNVANQRSEKQPESISIQKKGVAASERKPGISKKTRMTQKPLKNNLKNQTQDSQRPALDLKEDNSTGKTPQTSTIVPPKSLVEDMFNVAIARKNHQSRNKNKSLFKSENNSVATTTIKTVKKPAVQYGISSLPSTVPSIEKPPADSRKITKRANQKHEITPNNNILTAAVITSSTDKKALRTKEIILPIKTKATDYPTWKHELQALLGLPKPVVNGNPGLMSFNELKVLMQSEKNIDNRIFQQTYKDVGYDSFQKYLDENSTNIISMLRNRKNSSL